MDSWAMISLLFSVREVELVTTECIASRVGAFQVARSTGGDIFGMTSYLCVSSVRKRVVYANKRAESKVAKARKLTGIMVNFRLHWGKTERRKCQSGPKPKTFALPSFRRNRPTIPPSLVQANLQPQNTR